MIQTLRRLDAAGQEAAPLRDPLLDVGTNTLTLTLGDERPELRRGVERVAGREALGDSAGDLLGLGEPPAGDDHPRQRAACLPGVLEAFADAVLDRLLEVGVVEDHVCRLAAKLERDALDARRRDFADATAGTRRAGEREHVDVGVRGERLADRRPVAGDEVEDPRRQADRVDDLGEHEGVERRDLARLDDHRAARGKRRRDLGRDLVERIVPWRDRADDTDRLTDDQRVADLRLPLELGEQRGERAEVDCGERGLDAGRELERHPDLPGDQLGDLVGALAQRGRDPLQPGGPLRDRRLRPVIESLAGSGNRAVNVRRVALGDRPHHLLGRRVDDVDAPGTVRLHPLAPT